jgi:hypothetical protein
MIQSASTVVSAIGLMEKSMEAKHNTEAVPLQVNNKELPLGMLCSILQQQTGQATTPSNIHSVLGSAFGPNASVLVGKVTGLLTQFQGSQTASQQSGGAGKLVGVLLSLLKMCSSKPQTQEGGAGGYAGGGSAAGAGGAGLPFVGQPVHVRFEGRLDTGVWMYQDRA